MYPDLTREEAISIFRHERIRYERCDQEFYFSNIVPERNAWCYEIPLKIVATGCVEHISLLAYNGEDGELYNIKVPTAYLIAQQSGLDVHQENKVIHLELSADPVNWLRDLRSGSQNLDFSVFKAHPGDGYSYDGLLHKRIIQAVRTQKDRSKLYDPIEDEPLLRPIFSEVAAEVKRAHADAAALRRLGRCFEVWHDQARILRDRFGIIWYSPSSMNPGILFD